VYLYCRHHDARSEATELYPVYFLSGLCLFSVATATASPLKEGFQTDTLYATCSCRQHLFQLTIIDLVLCSVFAHKLTPVISVAKSFSVVTTTALQTSLDDRYRPILLGDGSPNFSDRSL
jgi:hypothetical protein